MTYEKDKLPKGTPAFQAPDGRMLVEKGVWASFWAYSLDGATYGKLLLQARGTSADSRRHVYEYWEPVSGHQGQMVVTRDQERKLVGLELDGRPCSEVTLPRDIVLPEPTQMRLPWRVLQEPGSSQLVVVTGVVRRGGGFIETSGQRVYAGDAAALFAEGVATLPAVEITDRPAGGEQVLRLKTAEGPLVIPRRLGLALGKRATPTWKGQRMWRLMTERFLIAETGGVVEVRLNPGHAGLDGVQPQAG